MLWVYGLYKYFTATVRGSTLVVRIFWGIRAAWLLSHEGAIWGKSYSPHTRPSSSSSHPFIIAHLTPVDPAISHSIIIIIQLHHCTNPCAWALHANRAIPFWEKYWCNISIIVIHITSRYNLILNYSYFESNHKIIKIHNNNPLTAKLFSLNFHPLEVVLSLTCLKRGT